MSKVKAGVGGNKTATVIAGLELRQIRSPFYFPGKNGKGVRPRQVFASVAEITNEKTAPLCQKPPRSWRGCCKMN
jgi:hypothetical protein